MILAGKRILITGGSSGLGRQLVCTFAREGAKVAFSSLIVSSLSR